MKPIKLKYVFLLAILSIFFNFTTLGTVFIFSFSSEFFNSFIGQILFCLRDYFKLLLVTTSLFNWLFFSTFIYYYLINYFKNKDVNKEKVT